MLQGVETRRLFFLPSLLSLLIAVPPELFIQFGTSLSLGEVLALAKKQMSMRL